MIVFAKFVIYFTVHKYRHLVDAPEPVRKQSYGMMNPSQTNKTWEPGGQSRTGGALARVLFKECFNRYSVLAGLSEQEEVLVWIMPRRYGRAVPWS